MGREELKIENIKSRLKTLEEEYPGVIARFLELRRKLHGIGGPDGSNTQRLQAESPSECRSLAARAVFAATKDVFRRHADGKKRRMPCGF
jgi:hypothetical protein